MTILHRTCLFDTLTSHGLYHTLTFPEHWARTDCVARLSNISRHRQATQNERSLSSDWLDITLPVALSIVERLHHLYLRTRGIHSANHETTKRAQRGTRQQGMRVIAAGVKCM